jgi:transcription elongation factor GreA
MNQQMYLTPEGAEKLRAELKELTGPRREELSQRLRSAIQMGDLSENADYHKAKEDQSW